MHGIARENVPVAFQTDLIEVRAVEVGEMTLGFFRMKKGADLTEALKGYGEHHDCDCPHWGIVQKGRIRMKTRHGDETYEAGEVFYWEPGHIPVALEDCEYMDFSPTAALGRVIEHVRSAGKPKQPRVPPSVLRE